MRRPLWPDSVTFLSTTAPGPLPVSSTARSHIPSQTFTHPRWRLSVTRSSARLRGVPVHKCAAAVSQAAGLAGLRWVSPWPERGQGPRWRQGGGRAVWSTHSLYTTLPGTHEKQSPGTCWPTHTGHFVMMWKQEKKKKKKKTDRKWAAPAIWKFMNVKSKSACFKKAI